MMDINQLIADLQEISQKNSISHYKRDRCADAATALSTLQAENERLKSLLGESGQDLWSKENQRADRLEAENEKLRAELEYEKEHANAYYEECGQWEAENTQLRAELEQVKRENETLKQFLQNWHEVEED